MNPSKEDINRVFPILNKYTALLFQKTQEYDDVDSLRQHLFLHKGKSYEEENYCIEKRVHAIILLILSKGI